jgi:hypothetical protein
VSVTGDYDARDAGWFQIGQVGSGFSAPREWHATHRSRD